MTSIEPPFGITVCGIDELAGHCEIGATHVLSILDPDHPVPEAFGTYGEHDKLELRFHDIVEPDPGMIPPERQHVERVLAFGRAMQAEQTGTTHLLVHCHAGISRSTASMALILAQALPEQPAETILALVYEIRAKAWPNLRMVEMGDAMLGRGGTLVEATHRLHRLQLDRREYLAEMQEQAGRGREVASARNHPALLRSGG